MGKKSELLSIKDYCEKMKVKYKDELEIIDTELLRVGSFESGELLYYTLEETEINPELKYYVFLNWWSSIDAAHEKFNSDHIMQWIKQANIKKLDLDQLTLTDDGYVRVYRGVNEYSLGWNALSWTTDKQVALKFAWGARVRRVCKNPYVLVGKVCLDFILGTFDNREESEVLCHIVESDGKLDVKELLEVEEKFNTLFEEIKEGKAEHTEEFEVLRKRYRDLQIKFDMLGEKLEAGVIPF